MTAENAIPQSVLVVDDHEEIRELLRDLLEDAGCRVFEAADGREALEQAACRHIDLLVTDLIMPEKEGLETIRELRATQPGLKILAICGALDDTYLRAAKLLGADATARKPFNMTGILAIIERLLGRVSDNDGTGR